MINELRNYLSHNSTQTRSLTLGKAPIIDEEQRLVEVAFSSELPYQRSFGVEILSHERGAMDLSRLNGGANVLMHHDHTQIIGVVESARVDADKVGRAVIRISRSKDADGVWQDIKDGVLRNISIGYSIRDYEIKERGTDNPEVLVTNFQPYEISFVGVPADPTVGVGRSKTDQLKDELLKEVRLSNPDNKEVQQTMSEQQNQTINVNIAETPKEGSKRNVSVNSVCGRVLDFTQGLGDGLRAARTMGGTIDRFDASLRAMDTGSNTLLLPNPTVEPIFQNIETVSDFGFTYYTGHGASLSIPVSKMTGDSTPPTEGVDSEANSATMTTTAVKVSPSFRRLTADVTYELLNQVPNMGEYIANESAKMIHNDHVEAALEAIESNDEVQEVTIATGGEPTAADCAAMLKALRLKGIRNASFIMHPDVEEHLTLEAHGNSTVISNGLCMGKPYIASEKAPANFFTALNAPSVAVVDFGSDVFNKRQPIKGGLDHFVDVNRKAAVLVGDHVVIAKTKAL